jgi:hypothetical protein
MRQGACCCSLRAADCRAGAAAARDGRRARAALAAGSTGRRGAERGRTGKTRGTAKRKSRSCVVDIATQLDKARHAYLGPELKRMRRVLRRLQFTTEDDVIDTKGRVACEIQATDEVQLFVVCS